MSDRDVLTDNAGQLTRYMQHGAVLNVRSLSDFNAIDVAAENGVEPDACLFRNSHIAD
jgi:hypothetical protein